LGGFTLNLILVNICTLIFIVKWFKYSPNRRSTMKKLAVILMTLALVLAGATLVLAQDVPQALKGVNLATAQVVTSTQAQQIRGASTINNAGLTNAGWTINGLLVNGNPAGHSTGIGTYNVAGSDRSIFTQLISGFNTDGGNAPPPTGLPIFH
jgi:cell division protein YceG involved in septum cleavage